MSIKSNYFTILLNHTANTKT